MKLFDRTKLNEKLWISFENCIDSHNIYLFNLNNDVWSTLLFVKYKEEPIENTHVTITSTEDFTYATPIDVTEIWGEGELSTVTEQVHSKKWGRSKKGEDSQEEVSTITDSSSVYED